MKSSTRLDSVIFQLTPTRTRCDLIIIANEKKEKIASGLLNPFLAHLRAAQDQIARGGYSILLQPEAGIDATWFTKGTVERFVRFVSTPEILERVYTIESEILQIEEAIKIQGCNDNGLRLIEDLRGKSSESSEGTQVVPGVNEEKAIVLYEPGAHLYETNDLTKPEGNSRVQLLKVLETRKTVLQKEQGMAFARAVAASFDIDHMAVLVSFAECFGASRLLDACLRFMELWKRKHETGQWLEIEAEAMSSRSDFSAMNASGIVLASVAEGHKNIPSHIGSEAGGKAAIDANADEVPSVDRNAPLGQQEYFQGQCPHIFPAWPMQSPPGALPVYQAYTLQGMPYYQNCSGNGPFYQSSYPPMDNSQSSVGHKTSQDRGSYSEFEMHEVEKDVSRKKVGRSGKKKQGTVVIRNINYIASKAKSSGSESESFSGSETDIEGGEANAIDMIHKSTSKSSKRKGDLANAMDDSLLYEREETNKGKETGHWQAFEDSLLRGAEESNHSTNEGMFLSEKDGQWKRHQSAVGDDTLALGVRDTLDIQDGRITEHQAVNGMHRMLRASNDEASISTGQSQYGVGRGATEDQIDMHFMETNGRKVVHRTRNDDFIIGGRENRSDLRNLSYPLTMNGSDHVSNDLSSSLLHGTSDESFLVPFRLLSIDQSGTDDRTAIDMDYELPLTLHKSENVSDRIISQVSCEPDDLGLIPERGAERRTIGYDPALDYEMEVCIQDTTTMNRNNGEIVTDVKRASVKSSDKVRKSKRSPDILDKKKVGDGPIRKGKPSKMSPIEDARARAEKLRIYKADLWKMKKEKEEVELNRLEALKMERQKRIAARGSSSTSSQSSSLEPRKQLPRKLSPVSHGGSKFSDSEPGSSLPLERSKTRTSLVGSNGSQKVSKAIKSRHGIHLSENRLSRSVSSLSETNKESIGVTPDSKASMSRIRRLSEPRSSMSPAISVKVQSTEPGLKTKVSGVSKPKASYGPEKKKISAIINLDKSKAAILPELKIKTSKGSSSLDLNKSAQTELQKVNGNQSSVVSKYSEMNVTDDMSHPIDVDDNPVIEKTVVLECEKPSIPFVHSLEERRGERKEHHGSHEMEEKIAEVAEYSAIRAPSSSIDGVDIISCQVREQSNSNEVMTDNKEKGSSLMISSARATEKSYQAPYAQVSSLEDPCTVNSEYGKAPQNNLQMVPRDGEIDKARVSDFKCQIPEKIPENLEKSHVKESSKGFKRLLKFGRKNQSSSAVEHSRESVLAGFDSSEQDETTKNASPSEVHTLKNLISEDETSTSGNTSQKASRHFSLFSPFRSKTFEKKVMM